MNVHESHLGTKVNRGDHWYYVNSDDLPLRGYNMHKSGRFELNKVLTKIIRYYGLDHARSAIEHFFGKDFKHYSYEVNDDKGLVYVSIKVYDRPHAFVAKKRVLGV